MAHGRSLHASFHPYITARDDLAMRIPACMGMAWHGMRRAHGCGPACAPLRAIAWRALAWLAALLLAQLVQAAAEDALEARFGFPRFAEGAERLGWLMNMQQSCMADKETGQMVSAIDCYFMCQVRSTRGGRLRTL